MSIHITTAMVKQYQDNVYMMAQQKTSRFEKAVEAGTLNGEEGYFEQIGATQATKRTTRHADTNYTNTPHYRRRVISYPWDWADLIDKADKARILIDPQGNYTRNAVMALNRAKDDTIIEALTGTAYGGKNGATAYSISNTVAVDLSGSSEGMTVEKVIRAKKILMAGEVDEDDDEQLFMAYRAQQLEDMLKLEKVTSSDYAAVKALINGEIDTWMGFKWIHSERLERNTSTDITTCVAWAKSGVVLATAEAIETYVDRLPGKNQSVQVWAGMDIGAVRLEEDKVVPVYCDESPA